MIINTKVALLCLCLLFPDSVVLAQESSRANTPLPPPQSTTEDIDLIKRIKDEGLNRSEVSQTVSYLTEVIGPRLTGSPALYRANEWTRHRLTSWGLQNAHLEPWGPFGRGWTLKRFYAQITEPLSIPLNAYPKAWSPGTTGTLIADVVYVDAKDQSELQKYKGRLKGTIVLTSPPREIKPGFEPMARRQTDKELLGMADDLDPTLNPPPRFRITDDQRRDGILTALKYQFFAEEGAALLVDPSNYGDGGTVFAVAATVPQPYLEYRFDARRIWPWQPDAPAFPPQIAVAIEQYNRLVRMTKQGLQLKMEIELGVEFQDRDRMAYNTLAEMPGTDLKDEVVMLGAHLDSWHAGTGATDNGTGVAVVMEAVRILQALRIKPRRTIRVALWTGEEQGLRGSRSYVLSHFAGVGDNSLQALMDAIRDAVRPAKLQTKSEYETLSVYFNIDTGTGKVRGLYLQGNEAARAIFRHWLSPFRDSGSATLSISNIDGSDHLPFDAVGLPSFQFIQDQIEYRSRTWHTNQDLLDRVIEDDLKHNSVVLASLVYNAAMADGRFPRKWSPTLDKLSR